MSIVRVCDVTLRDGEQACDVAFNTFEKVAISQELETIGVDRIQVAHGDLGGCETVRAVKDAGVRTPLEILIPAFKENGIESIAAATKAGVDSIHVFMRGKLRLLELLGISGEGAISQAERAVAASRAGGVSETWFSISFATQADRNFLMELAGAAVGAGACGVYFADSLGVALPDQIGSLVADAVRLLKCPVGVHCHNDYGLAVACTLAGLRSGASWCDASVLGLGERGGNASLEQVAMAANLAGTLELGLDYSRLTALAEFVSGILGREVPAAAPVVGRNAFAQKLDLHVQLAAEHPELFEPFSPELVGNRRGIQLGKGSGPYAVMAKAKEWQIELDGESILASVRWVDTRAESNHGHVSDAEFLAYLRQSEQIREGVIGDENDV